MRYCIKHCCWFEKFKCPKCDKDMVYKITRIKKKELYECLHCNHIIWVK